MIKTYTYRDSDTVQDCCEFNNDSELVKYYKAMRFESTIHEIFWCLIGIVGLLTIAVCR